MLSHKDSVFNMVQIIQEKRRPSTAQQFGQAFGNVSQSLGESIPKMMMEREQQQAQNEEYQRQNKTYEQLTGRPLSRDQKIREKEIEYALRGDFEGKKSSIKSGEDQAPLNNAIQTINQMRDIRKKGNLGLGTGLWSVFGGKTAKDKGEYEQLGKSLIQYATSIPIRNKLEFETLAERLYDASITDAEAEGVLDAMERIIQGSLPNQQQQQPSVGMQSEPMKQKRPLNMFVGKR